MDPTSAAGLLSTLRAMQAQNAAFGQMIGLAIKLVEPATDPRPALPPFADTFDSIPDEPPAPPVATRSPRRRANGR